MDFISLPLLDGIPDRSQSFSSHYYILNKRKLSFWHFKKCNPIYKSGKSVQASVKIRTQFRTSSLPKITSDPKGQFGSPRDEGSHVVRPAFFLSHMLPPPRPQHKAKEEVSRRSLTGLLQSGSWIGALYIWQMSKVNPFSHRGK